ncbi:uncharacterized protein LOC124273143 [Haliotis rubra]|uniref:uncharacterized protein LOC124273143 n=1 Tax=Haliotis rubra TaxID=36100 RepID=UPI001EE5DBC5|nr:uncharacterized protein LOC124273143 [Haliotis rubra]
MTSKHIPRVFNSTSGLLAVMREFLASVDRLNQTVLFPVRLQDLDQSQLTSDDQLLQLIKQTTDDDKEAMDLFAVYMLLLNTRSELLSGCDVAGKSSAGDSLLGQQLKSMASMLQSLTKMANTIRGQYETSLYLV